MKSPFLLEMPSHAKELLERRKREKSIVNFLLGSDGQVYRGRYKMVNIFQIHIEADTTWLNVRVSRANSAFEISI